MTDPIDVGQVTMPVGKNGGIRLPLSVIIMLLGIILWTTKEAIAILRPAVRPITVESLDLQTKPIVDALDRTNEILLEQQELIRDDMRQGRSNGHALVRLESDVQDHRRVVE